jgi:hypothetical protein
VKLQYEKNSETSQIRKRLVVGFVLFLVLLLPVTPANAKRARFTAEWWRFYKGAVADVETRQFEEAKRKLILAGQCYDHDTDEPWEEIQTTFAKAVVDFYLKDYKSCETGLALLAKLEPGYTRHQPGEFLSNPLELLGDLRRAEGKDQLAREQYRNALESKKYHKMFYSPLQEKRLLNKLSNIQSETDVSPSEYLSEYTVSLGQNVHQSPIDDLVNPIQSD